MAAVSFGVRKESGLSESLKSVRVNEKTHKRNKEINVLTERAVSGRNGGKR